MKALKTLLILCVIGGLAWYGWTRFHHKDDAPAAGGMMMGMPSGPVPVTAAEIKAQPVRQWLQFSGRLVAVDTVEIRPRVGGAIQTIYFQPGQIVEKNAPLFLIDPRPYQAELNRATAALAAAEAQSALAQTDLDRAQRLVGENAISQRDADARQNANRVSLANKKAAVAAVEQARLNLNYATIAAPVKGRISRAEITQGNLVNPANAPVLATIVSVDSIYADFEVDEQTYIAMIRKQNAAGAEGDADLPVELALNSDTANGDPSVLYKGQIVSFDNKLDPTSGTIRARAIFANEDGALVPGMYANIRLGQAEPQDAILIPERLVSTDQDKKFVYIVDAKNTIAYRQITLGGSAQGMRIVTSGLQDGDKVVTDGLQSLRPDMPVTPKMVPLTASVMASTTDPKAAPAAH